MKSEVLSNEIDSVHSKFAELRAKIQALDADCLPLIDDAMRHFSQAIEELVAAYEDVEQINADLIQTQLIADLERQRYKDLFENAPLGYLIIDQAGEIQVCNAAACQLLQTPRELLVGQSLIGLIDEHDQRQLWPFIGLPQKTGAAQDLEFHLKRTHPAWEQVLLRISGPSDPHPPPSEIWVSVHDLSW